MIERDLPDQLEDLPKLSAASHAMMEAQMRLLNNLAPGKLS